MQEEPSASPGNITSGSETKKRKTLEENLKDILQCPICLLVPNKNEKVNVCDNGHMICNECRTQISLCPICRSDKLEFQSPLLKKILDSLPSRCPNYDSGCQESFEDEEERKQHKINCEFRKIDCMQLRCEEKVMYKNLLQHLRDSHFALDSYSPLVNYIMSNSHFEKNNYYFPPTFFKYFDNETFIFMFYSSQKGFYAAECFYHGSEIDASKYLCEITFKNAKDGRIKIINCGYVIPVDTMKQNRIDHPGNEIHGQCTFIFYLNTHIVDLYFLNR